MLIEFCLPVKNEESLLEANVLRLFDYLNSLKLPYSWQIVILINDSSDNSPSIAKRLAQLYLGKIKVINYSLGGKSLTLRTYFNSSQADILAFMDIDLSTQLDHLPDLINPLIDNQADLVVGSRLLAGSQVSRSRFRSLSTRFYNRLAQIIFNNQISDLQCGFKACRSTWYRKISPYLKDDRWLLDTELIVFTLKLKGRLLELPVTWQNNRYFPRKSKVKRREIFYFIKGLLIIRTRLKIVKKETQS